MKKLVIDIETVGMPWEEHDPYVREYLLKGMNEAEAEEEKRRGALSPFTGQIVTIGIVNAENGRACAMYQVPGQTEVITRVEGNRTLISGTERQILEKFWQYLGKEDRFISFNGRQFDGPFLMIRSAIHGVVPKRDLVGSRYRFHPNCDLREVLNFNGTVYGKQVRFNLDLACKAFGITSSKTDGMDGRSVETMYRTGRHEEIALYCLEDVRATCELYLKLEATMLQFEPSFREAEERHFRALQRAAGDAVSDPDLREPEIDLPEPYPVPDVEMLLPSSESLFMASIEESSFVLAEQLSILDDLSPLPTPMGARHQAAILEKLAHGDQPEEEFPTALL
jgi:DNA polymerase III epsilon subunit-like protein